MLRTAILVLLLLASPLSADVRINPVHRVANVPPGCCGWCAMATALQHFDCPEPDLVHWHQCRDFASTQYSLAKQLDAFSIHYRLDESANLDFLRQATDAGEPVIIGHAHWRGGYHAVLVVDVTDTHVIFIDSNDTSTLYQYSRDDFTACWLGWGIAIERP